MRKKKRKLSIFAFVIVIIILLSVIIMQVISNRVAPLVMDYSVTEMKRIASIILNKSVTDDVMANLDIDKLFIITRSSSDDIISVTLDSAVVNKITNQISDKCEENLRKIENGKFGDIKNDFNIDEEYFYVPIGIAFKNTILNDVGPKVPIKLKIVGNVTSGITTDIKEYGINNSLITISVEVKVEMMVVLPFSSDFASIKNVVPIAIKLIQGKVPQFYGGSLIN